MIGACVLLTMLSLASTPTTTPPVACVTILSMSNDTSPLPQPKSRTDSPGVAPRSSRTGATNGDEYTKCAFLLYCEADHPVESGSESLSSCLT